MRKLIAYVGIAMLIFVSGCATRAPQRLLEIASGFAVLPTKQDVNSSKPTSEERQKALRSLLQLQKKTYGVEIPAVSVSDTTGIDHIYVETLNSSENNVTLIATPNRLADSHAPEGDYWRLEQLVFDRSGKLLSRRPYKHS